MKSIYVVISETKSILSRIITRVTGDKFTHASVSLEENLDIMYSFGRIWANNPFIGGFVKESVSFGTMKKFRKADIVVIELSVTDEKYDEIKNYLLTMYDERKKYHYNYKGLFKARRGIRRQKENCFYCSEFVRHVLERFELAGEEEFSQAVRPAEFLNVRRGKVIYTGRLCEYNA